MEILLDWYARCKRRRTADPTADPPSTSTTPGLASVESLLVPASQTLAPPTASEKRRGPDHDPQERQGFLKMKAQLGRSAAIHRFSKEHAIGERVLYSWSKAEENDTLPPPGRPMIHHIRPHSMLLIGSGMQRLPGAGRPAAYPPSATPRVAERLNAETAALGTGRPGVLQVKSAFAEESHNRSWDGKQFKYSTTWARNWLEKNHHLLHSGVPQQNKPALSVAQTRASLVKFLAQVYKWRLEYALGHGPIGLELSFTASRILSLDEVGLFLEPNKKSAFTVLLCTTAAGHIHIPLVIFDGVLQPDDPLVQVDGVWFLTVYNDTHWNNSFAYRAYLEVLLQGLKPCLCGRPCSPYCLIYDRFAGHESEEISQILAQLRVTPVVVEDTTRGAPNDFCFNNLIRTRFDHSVLQVIQDRAKTSAEEKRQGKPGLPALTPEETRQLALYHLRHVMFDEHGNVHNSLRHSIQHFYKHTSISLALDGSDASEGRIQLQDGSRVAPPLPDLSAYSPAGLELPHSSQLLRPSAEDLKLQAKREVRKAIMNGEVAREEALQDITQRHRGTAYNVALVANVLKTTSLPCPSSERAPEPALEPEPQSAVEHPVKGAPKHKNRAQPDISGPSPTKKSRLTSPPVDTGERTDAHPERLSSSQLCSVKAGDICYVCFAETAGDDLACDPGRKKVGCAMTVHEACYTGVWQGGTPYKRCPCRFCLVCLSSPGRGQEVVTCTECKAELHLECAKQLDYFCPLCKHAFWPKLDTPGF